MDDFQRIKAAEWVGGLRFRLHFLDGAAGIVDLAPELGDDLGMLSVIWDRPAGVMVAQRGRALLWLTDAGQEVGLDADVLREMLQAERRAVE